jgi:hypothetical protein
MSLLSGIALKTLFGTTGSSTKPSRLTMRRTLMPESLLNAPMDLIESFSLDAAVLGLSYVTLGICGALERMIELSYGAPVMSLPVVSGVIPEVNARRPALIAAPKAEGIPNSFAPHVERRLSVNLPPYW